MRRFLAVAYVSVLLAAGGCAGAPHEATVDQPIDFPHGPHLTYFASGQHRTERIAMHLAIFDTKEAPQELAEGRCVECHDDLAERTACAGCHVPFQNAALRGQRDVRKCVSCHRGAWGASAATIPSAEVCRACHESGLRLARAGDNRPRVVLASMTEKPSEPLEDVPWVRIGAMPPNVYFSHTAHVRYAAMPCTECHQDMSALQSPPSRARVMSMSDCLTCHVRKGASTDCLTCHK